jgi:hypothetical protein
MTEEFEISKISKVGFTINHTNSFVEIFQGGDKIPMEFDEANRLREILNKHLPREIV